MITLSKKLKEDAARKSSGSNSKSPDLNNATKRVSIRDRLLIKEVPEMTSSLPSKEMCFEQGHFKGIV